MRELTRIVNLTIKKKERLAHNAMDYIESHPELRGIVSKLLCRALSEYYINLTKQPENDITKDDPHQELLNSLPRIDQDYKTDGRKIAQLYYGGKITDRDLTRIYNLAHSIEHELWDSKPARNAILTIQSFDYKHRQR